MQVNEAIKALQKLHDQNPIAELIFRVAGKPVTLIDFELESPCNVLLKFDEEIFTEQTLLDCNDCPHWDESEESSLRSTIEELESDNDELVDEIHELRRKLESIKNTCS
jgi:predicted RNase H-like nuclease (RuvC/YqgF family)